MVDALLDTGFDGDVALPQQLVAEALPDGYLPWVLADGSNVLAPAYEGTVQIGSTAPLAAVMIALGEEPLVGPGRHGPLQNRARPQNWADRRAVGQ